MLFEHDDGERRPWISWRAVFAPLCVVALAAGMLMLAEAGYIKAAEHWTEDWRTALFSTSLKSQHEHVALVLITEETLQDSALRSPLDRRMLAKVIDAVADAKPAAIGLDIVFVRQFELDPGADRELMRAIRDAKPPLVLGARSERTRLSPKQLAYHQKFLDDAGRLRGHVFIDRKSSMFGLSDQVIRDLPGDDTSGRSMSSLSLTLARIIRPDAAVTRKRIAWLLPPKDGSQTFLEVEAQDLIGAPELAQALKEALAGKVVLIGVDLMDADRHLTPLSIVDDQRIAGVKIHAQMTAQLIDKRNLETLAPFATFLLLLGLSVTGYLAGRQPALRKRKGLLIAGGSSALVVAGFVAFGWYSLILPYAVGLATWIAAIGLSASVDKVWHRIQTTRRFFVARGLWRWQTYLEFSRALVFRWWRERL